MKAELSKYRRLRGSIRMLLLLGGLWPHLEETCRCYRLITCASAFVIAAMATKVLGFSLDNIHRLSVFVNGMCFIFSYYTSSIKVVYFVKYREDLAMLDNVLGKKFEEELKVKHYQPLLLKRITQYSWLTGVSFLLTLASLSLVGLTPIVLTLMYKKYLYIFHGKYPFHVEEGSWLYWSVIAVEASSGYFMLTLVSGIDNTFGLHCFRLCGMLRLLSHKFRQLRSVGELAECVRTHQLLLRCRDAIQRIYGPITLLTYLTSSLITCSLLYQVNQAKKHMTTPKAFFFTSYITLKLLQAFTYAYYGALISKESEKCLDAVYESDWTSSGDLRLMKNILFIQMQKPIVLNVKKFFIITMDMFAKIINTTISYFFLLQTVTNED